MTENISTHKSNITSYGKTNLQEVIRHMFVVRKSLLRPPRNAFEVYKVFAFAPTHILCSLCRLRHLPPTDKLVVCFFVFFDLLKHVHLHFKHVKEIASISAAVTVFGRRAGDVCLCDTDKI